MPDNIRKTFNGIKIILKEVKLHLSSSSADRRIIRKILSKKLTYLSKKKLMTIASECRRIEKEKKHGIFIEAGCALGGSSILIASVKSDDRTFQIYDVFGMIPPPTLDDTPDVHARYKNIVSGEATGIDGDKYYGYETDLHSLVISNMEKFHVSIQRQKISLVKGLVQNTLNVDNPVALAHIDVDWYEPVTTCLRIIYPKLVLGGCIILDDYHDWGGCKKATDEFIKTIKGSYSLDDTAGSMKITKIHD